LTQETVINAETEAEDLGGETAGAIVCIVAGGTVGETSLAGDSSLEGSSRAVVDTSGSVEEVVGGAGLALADGGSCAGSTANSALLAEHVGLAGEVAIWAVGPTDSVK
jgi:hypothetical protein